MDGYQQPNGVLENKLGITSADKLKSLEARLSAQRTATLDGSGAFNQQGFERLKAVHGHVFQDVYDWAGQARTTGLGKPLFEDSGDVTHFTSPDRIELEAKRIFGGAAAENYYCGLDRTTFVDKAAKHFADINELHPFREGNGRAQVAYIARLAEDAGHSLDFRGVSRERMVAVSIDAAKGDLTSMRRMFDELSDPSRARPLGIAADFLEQNRKTLGADWREHYLSTTTPGQEYRGDFLVSDGGGQHFIMLQRRPDRFVVGNAQDLPNNGQGMQFGQSVSFTATLTPEQKAQRWFDKVALEATPGRQASTIEAQARNLAGDAAAPPLSTDRARQAWVAETWEREKSAPGSALRGMTFDMAKPELEAAATRTAFQREEAREILPHVQSMLPKELARAKGIDQAMSVQKIAKGQGLDFVR